MNTSYIKSFSLARVKFGLLCKIVCMIVVFGYLFQVGFNSSYSVASGIIPPNNPPSDIAPNPNFFNYCSATGQLDNSTTCFLATLAAIDNARAQEGVGPMVLPSNYLSLPPSEQLFVATNAERVGRGLLPFEGLTQQLDDAALQGAETDSDPSLPSGYSWLSVGSNWAGGIPSVLGADYEWMYYDGYGSFNLDCTSPNAPGCWGHRDNILNPNYQCNPCTMGAADYIGSSYSPSYATIMVGDNSGTQYSYIYSFQQQQGSLTPEPYITSISPSVVPANSSATITVNGTNLANTVEIQIDGQNITNITQVSNTQVKFVAPSLPAGEYNITVITPGGETSYSSNSLLSYATAPGNVNNLQGVPGNQSVTLVWQAPTSNGGAVITGYEVSVYQGATLIKTINTTNTYINIGSLTNNTSYSFYVFAQNVVGTSAPESVSSLTPQSDYSPTVLMLTPNTGSILGNYKITIIGSSFTNATSVKFGNVTANFSIISDGLISATVPSVTSASTVTVTVGNPSGVSQGSSSQFNYVLTDVFTPIKPIRVVDTRYNSGYQDQNSTLGPQGTITAQLAGIDGIPASAVAVAANVTVANSTTNFGYLTIWPTGQSRPTTSNINFGFSAIANMQTLVLGNNDSVSIYNAIGYVDVIIDVYGYYSPVNSTSTSGFFNPIGPIRVADTRSYTGNNYQDASSTLTPGSSITVNFGNVSGLPNNISAVLLNVTATNTTSNNGYLTIYPSSNSMPATSNLNWYAGQTIANSVIVSVSATDTITITNSKFGSVDVIVDLYGYFTSNSANGYTFYPVSPLRICDTRLNSSVLTPCQGLTLGKSSVLNIALTQTPYATYAAEAIVANDTVTNNTNWSYLTLWPQGSNMPTTSNINWVAQETIANSATVAEGNPGVSIYNFTGYTDVIVDLQGLYLM